MTVIDGMVHGRYRTERTLAHHQDRRLEIARDLWADRDVVLKWSPLASALVEARCLLSLPAGIGPQLHDLLWDGSGNLLLVLEHFAGSTLQAAALGIPEEDLPRLVERIGERLGSLHRAGWVHGDPHPGNIMLLPPHERVPSVRFVDFGFSFDRFGQVDTPVRGGAPATLAPEILRGWTVDGRADLYSLGVGLDRLFPALKDDARWARLLPSLTDPLAGRRPRDSTALRHDVARLFDLEPLPVAPPALGGGPLQGRRGDLDSVLAGLSGGSPVRVLVQARPGTGLSRFLLETIHAAARARAPALQCVDFASLASDAGRGLAVEYVTSAARASVVCGVADPSPGLHAIPAELRARLTAAPASETWLRHTLPPLDVESFRDIVAASLGARTAASDFLAQALHRKTEGDLVLSGQGFADCLARCGSDGMSGWEIDPSACRAWASQWAPPAPEPGFEEVPSDLSEPLAVCARVGFSFPEALIHRLLAWRADPASLGRLVDHGYLRARGIGRLSFLTERLWRQATAARLDRQEEIDRWLAEHYDPDPVSVDDILQACRAYRQRKDDGKEAWHLARALGLADQERRWSDVLRLLAHPDPIPETWEAQDAVGRIERLAGILPAGWTRERLLAIAGACLRSLAPEAGIDLLREAASGKDRQAAARAHLLLLDRIGDLPDHPDRERHLSALRSLSRHPGAVPPGVVESFLARGLLARGRRGEAQQLAQRALADLEGAGLYEVLNLQILAAAEAEAEPERAVASLTKALRITHDSELEAQLRHNLAFLYGQLGRLELAEKCADEGIRRTEGRVSPARMIALRIQRAWSRADLDRVDPALAEARYLLQLPMVRFSPRRLVPALLLLAHCHSHRGSGLEALRRSVAAWETAAEGCPPPLQADCLRFLLDTMLDFEAWELVREIGDSLLLPEPAGDDPSIHCTIARAKAMRAQASGDTPAAAAELEARLPECRGLADRIAAARYLHHLGRVLLAGGGRSAETAAVPRAAALFREELTKLDTSGHGYHRILALIGLSEAHRLAGQRPSCLRALSRAIRLARSIESPHLLARSLESRASVLMGGS